ncbi:transporter substrate-binding domain-containing protein [Chitinivorax sp. B]|uniref:substrate-binding periplasmic protein n=1 Tax=Chitinivorax sp. B TaxID=2502235 RepID=UPI0010F5A13A|nr:transporter substrate-binding domain-containing protein [Chitinivorax sp. B]
MTRVLRRSWGWCLLYLFLAGSSHADTTVRLTNGDWPPFLSPAMPYDGLASRIVRVAYAERGINVEYGFFPWKRAFELAREGAWDGSVVWLKNAEREQQFYFSAPVIYGDYVFFHRRNLRFNWENMADIQPYRIGISDGYDYGKAFNALRQLGKLKTAVASSDLVNLRKLAGGRIDLFPMNRIVGLSLLAQLTPDEASRLTYHPKELQVETLHLILSRKLPRNAFLIEEFDKGLETIRGRGDIARFEKEIQDISLR